MQGAQSMGEEDTIAQVHPKELVEALMREATKSGCSLKIGAVDGMRVEGEGDSKKVTGVSVDGIMLDADQVVIAMGPWSHQALEWFTHSGGGSALPPMYGQKYHSVLYKNVRTLSQAVFFQASHSFSRGSSASVIFRYTNAILFPCPVSFP